MQLKLIRGRLSSWRLVVLGNAEQYIRRCYCWTMHHRLFCTSDVRIAFSIISLLSLLSSLTPRCTTLKLTSFFLPYSGFPTHFVTDFALHHLIHSLLVTCVIWLVVHTCDLWWKCRGCDTQVTRRQRLRNLFQFPASFAFHRRGRRVNQIKHRQQQRHHSSKRTCFRFWSNSATTVKKNSQTGCKLPSPSRTTTQGITIGVQLNGITGKSKKK